MKTCNLLVVRANNIRRLEFWFETLEISLIDGIPEEFRISVVRTFGTGFDVGESMFWALKKSGQVFV